MVKKWWKNDEKWWGKMDETQPHQNPHSLTPVQIINDLQHFDHFFTFRNKWKC